MEKLLVILLSFVTILSCHAKEDDIDKNLPVRKTELFGKAIPNHPRLLFSKEEEKRLKAIGLSDPLLQKLVSLLKQEADKLLTTSLLNPPNNLTISREHVYRLITLSLAYRMFDDKKYAGQAEKILINLAQYPSWNPVHYLDVAETTTAVAIAYDWLYDTFSNDTRALIKDAIITKALRLSIPVYEEQNNNESWAKRETNWNVVCNAGMSLGALAIAEDYDRTEKIIEYSAKFMPNCLKHYDPDGVCYEGPAYWEYTNIYLAIVLKAYNDILKDDFGLSDLPGVKQTAKYYVNSLSPSKQVFNFADAGGYSSSNSPVFFYFGNVFNQADVLAYYKDKLTTIAENKTAVPNWHFFLAVAWYKQIPDNIVTTFPVLQVFKNSLNPILVFNGDRNNAQSIYLTAKGGAPNEAHQQLDVGSFFIESEGTRWAEDLGSDNYSLPGFWDYRPAGQRWNYFRNTNLSHNTLTIDNQLQFSEGKGILSRYQTETKNPFGIIDMSGVYKDQAKDVFRGFKFLDNYTMLIQDDLTLIQNDATIAWSFVTKANVAIEGNLIALSMNQKSFYMKIIAPSNISITSEDAKPNAAAEKPISGYKIVKINVLPIQSANRSIQVLTGNNLSSIEDFSSHPKRPVSDW